MRNWLTDKIPEEGYEYKGCSDIRNIFDECMYDYSEFNGKICDICETNIGFISHRFFHPMHILSVHSCHSCAQKILGDSKILIENEKEQNRIYDLKVKFLKLDGQEKPNGNIVINYEGKIITIMKSKYSNGYGVVYNNNFIWKYSGKTIKNIEVAKLVAFKKFIIYE